MVTEGGGGGPVHREVAERRDAAMMRGMKPRPGDDAPDFDARVTGVVPEGDGRVALRSLRGERVVLVFYPKDRTPGCTLQACALRNAWQDLAGAARFFGVSGDPHESHRRFIDKHRLPYPLIADEDHGVASAYGVWVSRRFLFHHYFGMERSTFVIGADGRIEALLENVSPLGHLALLRKALA